MTESKNIGMSWRVRVRKAVAMASERAREFLESCFRVLLLPLLLTVDAFRVVLWRISVVFQRRILRQQRIPLGPCCDPTVERILVGEVSCPSCPFSIKYRNMFLVGVLCSNSQIVPWRKDEKICICARDHFMPAVFRWALGGCILVCAWIVVIAGVAWGAWQGRFALGFAPSEQSLHLPMIDARQGASMSESEKMKAADLVRAARDYVESKRYSAARIEYRNAIQKDPSLITAYVGLAECCIQLGFFGEAKEALAKAMELDPSSPTAYRRLTELAGRQRDFKQAIVNARKLCDLQPKDTEARLLLGNCYVVSGDVTNALREVSLAMSLAPSDPAPYVAAAYVEFLQKHYDVAEKHYRDALRMSSTNIAARIGLAGIYVNAGKMDEAIKSLNSALEISPASIDAILALGRLYCSRGDPVEAVALYRKKTAANPQLFVVRAELADLLIRMRRVNEGYDTAVKLNESDPGNVSSALILSALFLDQELLSLAEDYARKALRSNPNVIEGHKLLARIYMKRGDADRSLNYIKRIAQAVPDDFEIQLRLAFCLEIKKEADKAVQTLKELAAHYPDSPLPYLHLGQFYNRSKQFEKAIASYRQAAARKPESAVVLNDLASLLLDFRKDDKKAVDEAFQLATRAWDLEPENAAMADTLGWAHCRKGSYDEAIMLLSFAQKRAPSSAEVHYHLANALRGKGQNGLARAQLESALAISSSFPGADSAREMLEEMKREAGGR